MYQILNNISRYGTEYRIHIGIILFKKYTCYNINKIFKLLETSLGLRGYLSRPICSREGVIKAQRVIRVETFGSRCWQWRERGAGLL